MTLISITVNPTLLTRNFSKSRPKTQARTNVLNQDCLEHRVDSTANTSVVAVNCRKCFLRYIKREKTLSLSSFIIYHFVHFFYSNKEEKTVFLFPLWYTYTIICLKNTLKTSFFSLSLLEAYLTVSFFLFYKL